MERKMTAQTTDEIWFEFRAYNSPSFYGLGSAEEASRYADILNRKRSINVYFPHEMDAEDCEGLNSGRDTDGFRLDDALAAQAEIDADTRYFSFLVGNRVEAGEGEDHDTGTIVKIIDRETVLVAWDSQVTTPAAKADLTLV